MSSKSPWLTTGKRRHLPLTLERRPLEDSGSFAGGGAKTLWHTTEGGTVASVVATLDSKRAGVHFVIDPKTGQVAQCVALDRAGRGLEHVYPQETNRANVIQVEIVGFAAQSGEWSVEEYRHLAALALLIEREHGTPRLRRSFTKPVKFSPDGFVYFAGHCGHVHVPGNSHTDPGTGFRGKRLFKLMDEFDA